MDRPARWFVQTIEQSKQRGLPRPARPHDRQSLSGKKFEGRVFNQTFARNTAAEPLCPKDGRFGAEVWWRDHVSRKCEEGLSRTATPTIAVVGMVIRTPR